VLASVKLNLFRCVKWVGSEIHEATGVLHLELVLGSVILMAHDECAGIRMVSGFCVVGLDLVPLHSELGES